jgi:hypothetical protein
MKFGIGAIFRNEFDYILEWLAWHRLMGFTEFFIADNGSVDGTRQLLEGLADAHLIKLMYVPLLPGSQQQAYKLIQQKYGHLADAIAFIDADEFIYCDDGTMPTQYLDAYFSNPLVGAMGINWRIFGSSGEIEQKSGLVIQRFLHCASDQAKVNRHIKSIVRTQFIENLQSVHHFFLPDGFYYLNGAGQPMEFVDSRTDECVKHCSPFGKVVGSPLRINHYVIKSLQEFTEKKRKRGDATKDPNHDRGHEFFIHHDLNENKYIGASLLALEVIEEIKCIKVQLRKKTTYFQKAKGHYQYSNSCIKGWVSIAAPVKAKIIVYVNGAFRAETGCFRFRPDVARSNPGLDAYCGFQYLFDAPLQQGDVVNISLYSNQFQFITSTFTITDSKAIIQSRIKTFPN